MSTLKVRAKYQDGLTLVRILVTHPMETGRRRDEATGERVPAHFIRELRIEHNGKLVVLGELSTAVSKDPYLSFRFRGGAIGDKVRVIWTDNVGQSDRADTLID